MIYDNPYEKRTYTCPRCNGVFVQGNMVCAVYHIGSGCCHYGDTPVTGTSTKENPFDMKKKKLKLKAPKWYSPVVSVDFTKGEIKLANGKIIKY